MERKINVIVMGMAGSGKTTIAELIQELLIKEGFDSTHVEFEPLDERMRLAGKERRIESVKERVSIIITEAQAPRSGVDC